MSSYRFCPKCGGQLQLKMIALERQERLLCQQCGFIFYINPVPAVGVILLDDSKICLVKRKYAPRQGYWGLPAGFVEMDETVEEAAIREVKEETNLDVKIERLINVFSAFDSPKRHVIVIFYAGKIIGGALKAGDDALEVRFFPLNKIPEPLAFQSHTAVIESIK